MRTFIQISLLFFSLNVFSQVEPRLYQATRIADKIQIDGELNEPIWESGEIATNFIALEPDSKYGQ